MAHQSLYRRYRPQRFSEIRGQQHVRQALQNAVREGRTSHAYLFSGPRGTGKTTTARVLAKAMNCQDLGPDAEPCGVCESCASIEAGRSFDLHELDAASHNKVDDIRDLISKVHLGSPGRTKVYILDEVHMLSPGAENALLKTLEEPPDHVVFVLATTEPHKVVPTIRSRTQHFEFQLLPGDELADHVRWVIADAGLEVEDDAVDYVLRAGGGSARDTLSALDLVSAAGGVPAGSDVGARLAATIAEGDPGAALAAVQDALTTGREPRTIAEEALAHLRDAFLLAMGAPLAHRSDLQAAAARRTADALTPAALTRSLEALGAAVVEMRQAPDPRIPLEVCLLRLTRRTGEDTAALLHRIEALEAEVAALRAAGTTAAPAPAQPAATAAPAAAVATPPVAAADPAPAAPARSAPAEPAPAPVAATAPGPAPAPGGPPPSPRRASGPADAARRTLAEQTGSRTGPSPRPPAAAAPAAAAPPAPAAPGRAPTPAAARNPSPAAAPAEAAGPAPAGGPALTLAAVESVWGAVLDQLSNKARARFKPGRFLALDDGVARFALPNAIHRDRCEELRAEVEAGLAAAVGGPVRLRLEVDAEADGGRPATGAGRSNGARQQDAGDDDDIGDPSELVDAGDVAASSIERLTRAFPGSEIITHDD